MAANIYTGNVFVCQIVVCRLVWDTDQLTLYSIRYLHNIVLYFALALSTLLYGCLWRNHPQLLFVRLFWGHSILWLSDCKNSERHYDDIIMGAMASKITSLAIIYSTVYSGIEQKRHQSSESLAFVWGIHWWPVNSTHKCPVTRQMLPFDDAIMYLGNDELLMPCRACCFVLFCVIPNCVMKRRQQKKSINN